VITATFGFDANHQTEKSARTAQRLTNLLTLRSFEVASNHDAVPLGPFLLIKWS
jgi:hypothetical protein